MDIYESDVTVAEYARTAQLMGFDSTTIPAKYVDVLRVEGCPVISYTKPCFHYAWIYYKIEYAAPEDHLIRVFYGRTACNPGNTCIIDIPKFICVPCGEVNSLRVRYYDDGSIMNRYFMDTRTNMLYPMNPEDPVESRYKYEYQIPAYLLNKCVEWAELKYSGVEDGAINYNVIYKLRLEVGKTHSIGYSQIRRAHHGTFGDYYFVPIPSFLRSSPMKDRFAEIIFPNTNPLQPICTMAHERIHNDKEANYVMKVTKNLINGINPNPCKITMNFGFPDITKVVFNDPATIVFWSDGTKTVVKTIEGEKFDPYAGVAYAIAKKRFGNNSKFKKFVKSYIKEEEE